MNELYYYDPTTDRLIQHPEKHLLWNSDNSELFHKRYRNETDEHRKQYKKTSLLFYYCRVVTKNYIVASRLFNLLGTLGILSVVDVIEAENYIANLDSDDFSMMLFPASYKKLMLDIFQKISEGITIINRPAI